MNNNLLMLEVKVFEYMLKKVSKYMIMLKILFFKLELKVEFKGYFLPIPGNMQQLHTKIIQTHAQRKILVAIQVQTIIRRVRKCLPVRKSVRRIAITKIIAMEAEKRKICAAVATEKCFLMKKIFSQVLPDQKQKVVGQQPKTD